MTSLARFGFTSLASAYGFADKNADALHFNQRNLKIMVGSRDCLVFLLLANAALVAAVWASKHFGFVGGALGFIAGFVIPFAALYGVVWLWAFLEAFWLGGIPWLPVCENGRCKAGNLLTDPGDYDFVKERPGVFRCRCGNHYQRMGRRFVLIAADGTQKPYLVWKPLRGWCVDEESTKDNAQAV